MKYLFFSFLAVAFIACTGSDKHGTSSVHGHSNDSMAQEALKDTASYTTIEWVDSVHTDLGKISEGQSIEISWQFKKYRHQTAYHSKRNGWLRMYYCGKTRATGVAWRKWSHQSKVQQRRSGCRTCAKIRDSDCQHERQCKSCAEL